jgi:hypothetical protein
MTKFSPHCGQIFGDSDRVVIAAFVNGNGRSLGALKRDGKRTLRPTKNRIPTPAAMGVPKMIEDAILGGSIIAAGLPCLAIRKMMNSTMWQATTVIAIAGT